MVNAYDEEEHQYYYGDKEVPSVTQIAKPISFERLTSIPNHIVANAGDRGTRVHEYVEEYNFEGEIDFDEIDEDCVNYLVAYDEWFRTYRPKILFTELAMFSDLYAGRCDLICIIDGKVVCIDYKTTATIDMKSLSVQHAGYKDLALNGESMDGEQLDIDIEESYVLQLKKDGNYVFKKVEPDFDWFNALLLHSKKMNQKNK